MIRTLTGTIQLVADNQVVLSVHDVGYLIGFPTATTPIAVGQKLTLHTYLAVRETALDLYGFTEPTELAMFELLLGVPKVGPKSALQILNQATPTLISEAAHKQDGAYLHKLSGVGKKTCENIVQHLANKLEQLPATVVAPATELSQAQADAIDALIALGYDQITARETIQALPDDGPATVNNLITRALKHIS